MKKIALITLVILVALVALRYGFGVFAGMKRGEAMKKAMIPKVRLTTIGEGEVANVIEAPGRVTPVDDVNVVARIPGNLQAQYFKEGSYVKKGETLMLIEPQEYAAAVRRAQANLQSAQAQAAKAEKDYYRAKELVEKDYIPKSSYDTMLSARDVARAGVAAARTALNDAQRNYSYTSIKAPVSGRIGKIFITQGNYVTPQSGPLANIVSVDPIYVAYSIDSKQFNQLKNEIIPNKGDKPIKVEVTLPDGTAYKHYGKEDFWGNQISQSTGTIDLRATFPNPEGQLIAGDFVKVKIYSNVKTKKIVVPQSAVLQDSAGKYVYTVQDGKSVTMRITVGQEVDKSWVVTEGLKVGDQIIDAGVLKVAEQMPVVVLSNEEYAKMEKEEAQNLEKAKEDGDKK